MVSARRSSPFLAALALASASAAALPGCSGDPGRDGVDGADGAYAEASLACSAVDSDALLLLEYQVVDYSNGDVWTSCSVSDNYVEGNETAFYFAGQNGAVSAACLVTMDTSGDATAGWWEFVIDGADVRATYWDPDDINDGYVYEFVPADCTLIER